MIKAAVVSWHVLRFVVVGLVVLAACGEPAGVETRGSTAPVITTRTLSVVSSTSAVVEPVYEPIPVGEIDTGAATDLSFPRTEAQHAAWADWHNYPPEQAGSVTLTLSGCEIDAPGRIIYRGSVVLDGTERARLGLQLETWHSPVGLAVPVEVVFTRSGQWTIPVEVWGDLSSGWVIAPSRDRVSRCGGSVFWSDTPSSPAQGESVGFAEPTYVDFTFRFDGGDGELRRVGDGVRFTDWDHPARGWASVNWLGASVPFAEVWVPNPDLGVAVVRVSAWDDGFCRRMGISTGLGELWQLAGCDEPLVLEDAAATGETIGSGFEIWTGAGQWYAINAEAGLVVSAETRDSLVTLTGSLRRYTNAFNPPEPAADSIEALDRIVRSAFAKTDEVERGRAVYGDGYLIFSAGLTHVGEGHRDRIRTYRAHFDSTTWVLELLAEEPWDTCGYTRVSDDGSGPYSIVIAGFESWTIGLENHEAAGFLFATDERLLTATQVADIADPSGTIRCTPALAAAASHRDPVEVDGGWGPLAVIAGQGSGDQALTAGTLVITDTCVLLDERGEPALLVWPDLHTEWDESTGTIRYTNSDGSIAELRDGDSVTFGGGGSGTSEDGLTAKEFVASVTWIARPHPDCVPHSRWFVGDLVAANE